jgi:hypothetical protein
MPDVTDALADANAAGMLLVKENERLRADLARVQTVAQFAEGQVQAARNHIARQDAEIERQAEQIAALRQALEVARFYVTVADERQNRNVYADLAIVDRVLARLDAAQR